MSTLTAGIQGHGRLWPDGPLKMGKSAEMGIVLQGDINLGRAEVDRMNVPILNCMQLDALAPGRSAVDRPVTGGGGHASQQKRESCQLKMKIDSGILAC
jgi:hypothetical protein